MARTVIESYFRTSKMAAGGHFVQNFKKELRSVWIWNGQKCHRKWILDIQYGRSIRNGQKCDRKWFSDIQIGRRKKPIKFCIDLKWPELRSKVNLGNPKWPIDLKWPEIRSKVNFMINEIIMLHYSDVVSVLTYPNCIMTFLESVIGDNSTEEFSWTWFCGVNTPYMYGFSSVTGLLHATWLPASLVLYHCCNIVLYFIIFV